MRSILASTLCLLLAWAWCHATVAAADDEDRYNIIAIVTDDQARWSVGAYGNPEVRTPNHDRLAREGARFLNAFVPTPVCSPSRVSFLTGLYGTQVGITDFLCRQEERAGLGLPDSAITWPAVLQRHGYATARMIRTEQWKLVRYYRTNLLDELYDLQNDPGEMNNRYEDAAVTGVREQLQERLEAWMRSIDDPLLESSLFSGETNP
ncbi:MAG: sulfatase-like hydrolase/transferase [Planctomycetes bacterium]|nr:sulfatase-like hydrolase/transferase [Planctomycetota bacterium]